MPHGIRARLTYLASRPIQLVCPEDACGIVRHSTLCPKPAPEASLPLMAPNPVPQMVRVSPGFAAPHVVFGPPQFAALAGETRL